MKNVLCKKCWAENIHTRNFQTKIPKKFIFTQKTLKNLFLEQATSKNLFPKQATPKNFSQISKISRTKNKSCDPIRSPTPINHVATWTLLQRNQDWKQSWQQSLFANFWRNLWSSYEGNSFRVCKRTAAPTFTYINAFAKMKLRLRCVWKLIEWLWKVAAESECNEW